MERRRDEQDPDRKMMEEIPQEPITADPTEENGADDDEDDAVDRPANRAGAGSARRSRVSCDLHSARGTPLMFSWRWNAFE